MKSIKTMIAILLVLMVTGSAWSAGWVTDFEAAKASAKTDGKYMLVDFTGSDWCGWCIRLKDEVFSKDHFKTEAPKNFILVELDFPRNKGKMTPELIAQNNKLRDKYSVGGYPTILLMDAEGRVFAKTGYQRGGPEKYIEHLNSLVEGKKAFDKLIAEANKAKGFKKAKLLDKALSASPKSVRRSRTDLIKQITDLDKDDKAGLKTKYEFLAAMDELEKIRPPRTRDPAQIKAFGAKSLAKVVEIEKKYPVTGADKQNLLSVKAMYTFYSGDLAGAKKVLETAIAIDDKSKAAQGMKRSLAFVNSRLGAAKPKD
ncbi:MAG: thioredoxin family protein [Phycisphaerae bacterium]|jgi:thioredoxin-related protein|nr:thioredoxin family protein [Phycisphaerae bacterium]MDP7287576.1 thioredoxin family protein [Phycisphaerae bacterium]